MNRDDTGRPDPPKASPQPDVPGPEAAQRPLTLLLCALGGEGGGVLSEWLFDAALRAGHAAQATSIPGVAQRTGATTYYVEIWPQPETAIGHRQPVFSLNPVPGAIDLLVSSELLETVRQIGNGMASAERTTVISAGSRALTVAEKMAPADGRVDDARLQAVLQRHARSCELMDLGGMAAQAGTVISAVMLGVVAASGLLPFARSIYEDTIRAAGKGVSASLKGFEAGFAALQQRRQAQQQAQAWLAPLLPPALAGGDAAATLPADWRQRFPAALHPLLALARPRLVDHQDAAWAERYAQRLDAVVAAERQADGQALHGWAISQEVARALALWMCAEDIVQVARLKAARSRWARLQRETGAREAAAGGSDLLRVWEHFKPGVPELAAVLPPMLARRLQAWDAARQARGLPAWALPLRLGRHTVGGMLALRLLAATKAWRRQGSGFAAGQQRIDDWLAAVCRGAAHGWVLGLELARCARLNKGYGSTHERGAQRLDHVLRHLAPADGARGVDATRRAAAIAQVREAALADAGGGAFDLALRQHGAPTREPVAQPVRWYRRRPAT